MTHNYHTPIPNGAAANADSFNNPLGEMDEALTEALLLERDGHIIQDEGVDLAQQARLDFTGAGVTVTNSLGKTTVTISGGITPPTTTAANDFQVGNGAGAWVKKTLAEVITILRTSLDGIYAALAHTHVASDIASGTIATARLGSGTANNTTYLRGDQTWQVISATGGELKNFFLNGGLEYAQRQDPATYTTIANDKYAADRLRVCRENNDVQYIRSSAIGEVGLTSYSFGTLKKITSTGKIHACQPIKAVNSAPLRGKAITFQLRLKASSSKTLRIGIIELQNAGSVDVIPATLVTAWGANTVDPTLGANLAIITGAVSCAVTTSWQLFSVTVTVPSNSKNILPAFWTDSQFAANDTVSFAELDLHIGSATQAWTPIFSEFEIQVLRSYCWKTFPVDTAPAQNAGVAGAMRFPAISAGATAMRTALRFPVPMRATPTITFYNPSAANANIRDSNAAVDGTIVTSTTSQDVVDLTITGNASTLVGNAMDIHILADSEL